MRIPARRLRVLGFLLLTCLLFITPVAAQTLSATPRVYLPLIIGPGSPSIEQQVVDLVNQQRQLNGCNVVLTISPQLAAAALAHSQDMAINNVFSHTGSNGSTLVSRVTATGYDYSLIAENIAGGIELDTPQAVVTAWMNSPNHRANILNCNLHEIGIGYYYQPDDQPNVRGDDGTLLDPLYRYWTQDFGTQLAS